MSFKTAGIETSIEQQNIGSMSDFGLNTPGAKETSAAVGTISETCANDFEGQQTTNEVTASQIVSVTSVDVPMLDLNAPEFDLSVPSFDWRALIREQRPILNMSDCQVNISFGKNWETNKNRMEFRCKTLERLRFIDSLCYNSVMLSWIIISWRSWYYLLQCNCTYYILFVKFEFWEIYAFLIKCYRTITCWCFHMKYVFMLSLKVFIWSFCHIVPYNWIVNNVIYLWNKRLKMWVPLISIIIVITLF